jgi:mannose-6-phosphate isomerase-like protein (cupin superfamily)
VAERDEGLFAQRSHKKLLSGATENRCAVRRGCEISPEESSMSDVEPGSGIALSSIPVHFAGSGLASTIDGFTFDPPAFEAYIAAHTSASDPGRLVFIEESTQSWGSWECHRAGDELVIIIAGVAIFIQEIDGAHVRTRVTPGQAVLNPAGTWHTADVEQPFTAIYLTPCPGTEHRPR